MTPGPLGGTAGVAPFVGRAAELDALVGFVGEARASAPRLVVIEGEAGIGKSTLMARLIDEMGPCRVARASGSEAEMLLPYGVLLQLFDSVGASSDLSGDVDPLAAGGDLVVLLGELQAGTPLVILAIDDLQWADSASATALLFAFRRLRLDRVLAVISARTAEMGRLGEGWTSMIGGDRRAARIPLTGLTAAELADLSIALGITGLSSTALSRLAEHTGGNPLHCRALLEQVSAERLNLMDVDLPAPRALASIVLTRVAALSEPARRLVVGAAVLGDRAPVSLLTAMALVADPVAALDEATGSGLLVEERVGSRSGVAFSHTLIHRAVYDDLGPASRRELHLRAAALTDGPTRLLHRSSAAVAADPVLAEDLETAANDAMRDYAPARAVAWLVRAAEVATGPVDRERLLMEAFRVATNSSDLATAGRLKARLEEFAPTPAKTGLIGHLALVSGQFALAEQLLVEAWTADGSRSSVGAQPAASLAMYLLLIGRSPEAVLWGERASQQVADDEALRRHIRNFLAMNLTLVGRGSEGMVLFDGLPLTSADMPVEETSALVFRGVSRLFLDDVDGAVRDLSTAQTRHRSGLSFNFDTHGLTFLVDAEYRAGAWDEAAVHAELAVSLAHDSDRVWDYGFVHAHAALVPGGRGEWDVAQSHLDEASRWASGFGIGLALAMVTTATALMRSAQEDWVGVLAAVDAMKSFGQVETLGRPGVHDWRASEVGAYLALGQVDAAAAALAELEAAAAGQRMPSVEMTVWSLRARVAQERGAMGTAGDAFARARALAPTVGIPLNVGLVELADGRRLAGIGRRDEAREALTAAHGRFARLGAMPYLELCERALSEAGADPIGHEASLSFGLTPTEVVVARLVASGKSNRDVAAELYVSVKAIEFHLGHIFDKLGVRSRHKIRELLVPR